MAPCIVLFVGLLVLVFGLVITAVTILVYCRIFSKAGYHWALGLLMLVPIANIIMPFVLAFGDWPAQKSFAVCVNSKTTPTPKANKSFTQGAFYEYRASIPGECS